ncbi:response regulator [Candidatus Parcubacteria bacterium]|nr:MAG: response regulator [Candidatus Parcubacteria bacterium]
MNKDTKKRILVVEDDRFLMEIYAHKFFEGGFDVLTALDGEEALEKAGKEKPDVILLDLVLPKIDGLEVLRLLRKNKDLSKTPVVVLTNRGEKSTVEKAVKLGATAYITKIIYTPTEVVTKVKSVMGAVNRSKK